MRIRVAYAVDAEPTRSTSKLLGVMTMDGTRVSFDGPQSITLLLSDIRGLSFRREHGLFHIALHATPKIYFTPIIISIGGWMNLMSERRNTHVYTALWRVLSGPGRCARCKYDLRESVGRCPECAATLVRPIA